MNKNDNTNTSKSSKRFLVIYSILLFVFAAMLIVLSYLSQLRVENEAVQIKKKLTDKTVMAESVQVQLDRITEKTIGLEKQIEELMQKNETLETENKQLIEEKIPELNKKIKAYELLISIAAEYEKGNTKALKTLVEEFIAAGYTDVLPDEVYSKLGSINKMIKGK